jgi:signal transduction histidine kinase
VIQQLKQQKHELQVQSKSEQHRARTTETFSQSVLSNLPCGVLVFGTNGLVKTSNPSAKTILGFASAVGMGAKDIFRGAEVRTGSRVAADGSSDEGGEPVLLWEEIGNVLRQDSKRREIEAEYETPAGEKRFVGVTISPVPSIDGGLLGVVCLINDLSELERIRLQQEAQGELSAEMAVQLRSSLATISGYAREIANDSDPELAKQRAQEITNEATQLNRSVDGFLTRTEAAKGAAAGISTD